MEFHASITDVAMYLSLAVTVHLWGLPVLCQSVGQYSTVGDVIFSQLQEQIVLLQKENKKLMSELDEKRIDYDKFRVSPFARLLM